VWGYGNPATVFGNLMITLSREQHCALADLDVEAFKTLQRYSRIPDLGARFGQPNGYHPFETFALLIAMEFRRQFFMSHEQAASIAAKADVMLPCWHDIGAPLETSKPEIFFGRVSFPGVVPPLTVCGTFLQIASDHPTAITFVGLSVSRIAAQMRSKAASRSIDLAEFLDSPSEAPSPTAASKKPVKSHSKRKSAT
jgi:hypothetical protein